jgi:hypothetical protein
MLDIGTLTFSDTWTGSSKLRILNLPMETKHDCEQLRSVLPHLRQLTTHDSSMLPRAGKIYIFLFL